MIVFIVGPDPSLVRDAARRHAGKADPDGQSTSEMDGNIASMSDVIGAISSVGFFSAGRVVIVNDFVSKTNKTAGRGKNAPDWSALFGAVPEPSTLILVEPSMASVPVGIRKALPPDAIVVEGDPPRGPSLVKWIRARAGNLDSDISDADARFLAEWLYPQSWMQRSNNPAFDRPPSLALIGSELDKLATAADPAAITRRHIELLVHQGDNDRIFGFIDAVIGGNLAVATTELDRLIEAGEDPHRMLAQLGQTVELTAILASAERREPAAVGKEIGLANPARMNAIARSLRGSSPGGANRALRVMTTADRMMKTGRLRDPIDVIQYVMTSLAPNSKRS